MSFNRLAVLFDELRFTGDEPNLARSKSGQEQRDGSLDVERSSEMQGLELELAGWMQ